MSAINTSYLKGASDAQQKRCHDSQHFADYYCVSSSPLLSLCPPELLENLSSSDPFPFVSLQVWLPFKTPLSRIYLLLLALRRTNSADVHTSPVDEMKFAPFVGNQPKLISIAMQQTCKDSGLNYKMSVARVWWHSLLKYSDSMCLFWKNRTVLCIEYSFVRVLRYLT